jgi:hypothetical protein
MLHCWDGNQTSEKNGRKIIGVATFHCWKEMRSKTRTGTKRNNYKKHKNQRTCLTRSIQISTSIVKKPPPKLPLTNPASDLPNNIHSLNTTPPSFIPLSHPLPKVLPQSNPVRKITIIIYIISRKIRLTYISCVCVGTCWNESVRSMSGWLSGAIRSKTK